MSAASDTTNTTTTDAPRTLAVQFARAFPDLPCRLTSEEMHRFATSQRGGHAPWHTELVRIRTAWFALVQDVA